MIRNITNIFSSLTEGKKIDRIYPGETKFKKSNSEMPVHLLLAISYNCLANCPHCYLLQQNSELFKSNKFMPDELFEEILNSKYFINAKKVTLSGGEALLHPNFTTWIEHIKSKKDVPIASISNGMSLLNEKLADKIINSKNISAFNISLDGINEQEYCTAKGIKKCNFNSLCYTIKTICDKFKNSSTRISGSFVVKNFDSNRIREIISFAESIGFHKINLHSIHLVPDQNRMKLQSFRFESFEEHRDKIMQHVDCNVDVTIKLPFNRAVVHNYCVSLGSYLCVGANGSIAPCCHIPWSDKYGKFNLFSDNIINHPEIIKMRQDFIDAEQSKNIEKVPSPCRYCIKRTSGHMFYSAKGRKWKV